MTIQVAASQHDAESNRRGWLRSPADGRLRAGWRIAAFLGIFYSTALPLVFGLRALLEFSKTSPLVIVIIAAAATPAVYLARRWIDKKSFVSLGLNLNKRGAADILVGFLLSGVMAGTVFWIMLSMGFIDNFQVTAIGPSAIAALFSSLVVMALVGFWEELVFRGYILQNMAEGMGMKIAILVSCAIYALIHSMNPNAGLLSTAIIAVFGYLRIYGYLTTGQLWLSIGMHTGWNFFQATVFGFAASGHTEEWLLFTHEPNAAKWLSGGDFGPEASVVTLPVVLAALLIMRAWSRSNLFR